MLLGKTLRSSTLKLASIYVVAFASAIFALFGYIYWITAGYLDRRLDASITAERGLLTAAYTAGGRDRLVVLIDRRIADPHFRDWVYLLADGKFAPVAGNLPAWPVPTARPVGGRRLQTSQASLPGGEHLLVGRDAAEVGRLGARITLGLAIAATLFLLLSAAAGISTSRRSVARIEAINATSRKIMQSGLGERIPLRGTRDEWDELAENLNSMLARIEALTESTRQVADNVAHDLRTPLTRLRGRLEKALSGRRDLAQYRTLVGEAIAELDNVLTTFSSLLRISRIEMQDRTAAFHRLDLTGIAREVVDMFDPLAEDAGVRLRLCDRGPVFVVGDRDLLFDAISNLVDNAIKHGGAGGEVAVAVAFGAARPVLSVSDHGPGIPREERHNVLRRFYRLERSRHSPGNGLGLSLVAAVATLHGAHIEMADNRPGLRLELHFPAQLAGNPPAAQKPSAATRMEV